MEMTELSNKRCIQMFYHKYRIAKHVTVKILFSLIKTESKYLSRHFYQVHQYIACK